MEFVIREDVGKSNSIDEATGSFRPIFKKWYHGGGSSKTN